jgi:hypothetical protein
MSHYRALTGPCAWGVHLQMAHSFSHLCHTYVTLFATHSSHRRALTGPCVWVMLTSPMVALQAASHIITLRPNSRPYHTLITPCHTSVTPQGTDWPVRLGPVDSSEGGSAGRITPYHTWCHTSVWLTPHTNATHCHTLTQLAPCHTLFTFLSHLPHTTGH